MNFIDLERNFEAIRSELSSVKAELAYRRLRRFLSRKYEPDQPRDDIGRWTNDDRHSPVNAEDFLPANIGTVGAAQSNIRIAARGSIAECEAQYERDSRICRIVKTATCWSQAMARRAACVSGYPLPPLNF